VRDEPFTEVGLPHRRMEKVLVGTSPAGE
jgi:hypothetical protein